MVTAFFILAGYIRARHSHVVYDWFDSFYYDGDAGQYTSHIQTSRTANGPINDTIGSGGSESLNLTFIMLHMHIYQHPQRLS